MRQEIGEPPQAAQQLGVQLRSAHDSITAAIVEIADEDSRLHLLAARLLVAAVLTGMRRDAAVR